MKLLISKRFRLPRVYFITNREDIKKIPIGVPFIYGDASTEKQIVRLLEYEILYQEAIKSGYPFNFRKILKDNGYKNMRSFGFEFPVYMDLMDETFLEEDVEEKDCSEILTELDLNEDESAFSQFIKDNSAVVDVEKLKMLKIFPIWLKDIEEAVKTNIHNFAVYNENMYNKKLEGMFGSLDLKSPPKNLFVIDISGSIPKGVSSTCLALAKNLAETFYADLLITGSKSTLYRYEEIHTLNVHTIYEENGMDNDQTYFKKLVTEEEKTYQTCIVFGDAHSPGWSWSNKYNKGVSTISIKEGQKLCRWTVNKVLSFYTEPHNWELPDEKRPVAGYAEWFKPKTIQHVNDWVKYLNN
jgi:hypothetical protein